MGGPNTQCCVWKEREQRDMVVIELVEGINREFRPVYALNNGQDTEKKQTVINVIRMGRTL